MPISCAPSQLPAIPSHNLSIPKTTGHQKESHRQCQTMKKDGFLSFFGPPRTPPAKCTQETPPSMQPPRYPTPHVHCPRACPNPTNPDHPDEHPPQDTKENQKRMKKMDEMVRKGDFPSVYIYK